MRTLLIVIALSTVALAAAPSIEINATFDPDTHAIEATATIPFGAYKVEFELNSALEVLPPAPDAGVSIARTGAGHEGWTKWEATFKKEGGTAPERISIHYKGMIYDPPKEEGGLRHVAGGHTGGTIGPEGVYLHGGTGWYPVLAEPMAIYAIQAELPKGWRLVGQGKRVSESEGAQACAVRWEDPIPANSLEVVAGKYVVTDDEWNGVRVSTYLFEEEKDFAKVYIDASKQFLEFYSKLLGPYPYGQFSVVENWYSTGFGMPSYTLLGREVVKMAQRYTGAVGLGHEIVHDWWGNSVFVDDAEGNWCEGLTSYCANYYWTEAHDGPEAAAKARRHLSERFTILCAPEQDFPLAEFKAKVTETDDEVGYDKACMLFHTIRRRIGDEAFWGALRTMAATFKGKAAKWSDFAKVFSEAGKVDVAPWVDAWIHSKGIPTLTAKLGSDGGKIVVRLAMENHLPCVVPIRFGEDNFKGRTEIVMERPDAHTECVYVTPIQRVVVDPDFDVLRRLDPSELVPCLNRVLSAPRHVIVKPGGGEEAERAAYAAVVEKMTLNGKWEVVDDTVDPATLKGASLMVLGRPGVNRLLDKLLVGAKLPEGVTIAADAYEVGGKKGSDPSAALLVSVPSPADATQVMTVFMGLSPESATKCQRYLFYYGWNSWYTFGPEGKAADRGDFPLGRSPLDLEPAK